MSDIVLTEHQQLCRTAHQQIAMLRHLYDDFLVGGSTDSAIRGFSAGDRIRELHQAEGILSAKLEALDLLPASPDPEWEGVLEAVTRLKRVFSAEGDTALAERLYEEELELLRLSERLAQHDPDPALGASIELTREALQRLKSATSAAG